MPGLNILDFPKIETLLINSPVVRIWLGCSIWFIDLDSTSIIYGFFLVPSTLLIPRCITLHGGQLLNSNI